MNHQLETSGGRTVNLFLCRPDSIEDESLFEKYHALLDQDERARCARYRFESDRRGFLVAHALVRVALARFGMTPPQAWKFRKNRYGRPEIDPPSSLRFSLSHTRGLVGCAVSTGWEVGLDIEAGRDSIDPLALASRFYAAPEAAALHDLPIQEQRHQFLSIWTLKEAYAKARGRGLSLPLDTVAFQIKEGSIEVSWKDESDNCLGWWFGLMRPTSTHWLAAAIKAGPLRPRIDTEWLVPLTSLSQATQLPFTAATRAGSPRRKQARS